MTKKERAQNKFEQVIGEFYDKELHHGTTGKLVTDKKMALAIAYSEAQEIDDSYGKYDKGGKMKKIDEEYYDKYFAYRKKLEVLEMEIRAKVAMAIGIENALLELHKDYVYHPFDMLKDLVKHDIAKLDEINKDLINNALYEADSVNDQYKDSGHGFGSSDHASSLRSITYGTPIKTDFVDGRLTRVDDKGNVVEIDNGYSIENFGLGGFILGVGAGVLGTKYLTKDRIAKFKKMYSDSKKKPKTKTATKSAPKKEANKEVEKPKRKLPKWKQDMVDAIEGEGVYYAITRVAPKYVKKGEGTKTFQNALNNFQKAHIELEKAIKKIKSPVAKKWVESVIDKEGFDYAFEGYDTFESVWNFDTKKRQKFNDANFHKARKKYLSTRKAVLKSVLGANYNEDIYAKGGGVAEGYHRMPDGTIMADSEHYAKGGEIKPYIDDLNQLAQNEVFSYGAVISLDLSKREVNRENRKVYYTIYGDDLNDAIQNLLDSDEGDGLYDDDFNKYVMNVEYENTFAKGGTTYAGGGEILEVEGGHIDLSPKEKASIYKWIENSPIFTADIESNEWNHFDLEKELSKKFDKTDKQSKSIIKGWEISRGYSTENFGLGGFILGVGAGVLGKTIYDRRKAGVGVLRKYDDFLAKKHEKWVNYYENGKKKRGLFKKGEGFSGKLENKEGKHYVFVQSDGTKVKVNKSDFTHVPSFAKGGEIYNEEVYNAIIEQLVGEREVNPKMKMTDQQISDLVADVYYEVQKGKSLDKVLFEQLVGEREVNPKMKMTDQQISDLMADVYGDHPSVFEKTAKGKTYAGGGEIKYVVFQVKKPNGNWEDRKEWQSNYPYEEELARMEREFRQDLPSYKTRVIKRKGSTYAKGGSINTAKEDKAFVMVTGGLLLGAIFGWLKR